MILQVKAMPILIENIIMRSLFQNSNNSDKVFGYSFLSYKYKYTQNEQNSKYVDQELSMN